MGVRHCEHSPVRSDTLPKRLLRQTMLLVFVLVNYNLLDYARTYVRVLLWCHLPGSWMFSIDSWQKKRHISIDILSD